MSFCETPSCFILSVPDEPFTLTANFYVDVVISLDPPFAPVFHKDLLEPGPQDAIGLNRHTGRDLSKPCDLCVDFHDSYVACDKSDVSYRFSPHTSLEEGCESLRVALFERVVTFEHHAVDIRERALWREMLGVSRCIAGIPGCNFFADNLANRQLIGRTAKSGSYDNLNGCKHRSKEREQEQHSPNLETRRNHKSTHHKVTSIKRSCFIAMKLSRFRSVAKAVRLPSPSCPIRREWRICKDKFPGF